MQNPSVDSYKRGRLILISILVTLFAFSIKIFQQSDLISTFQIYLNAMLVGVGAYIGLLWALRFQVSLRTMVYVLSQSALVVFIQTLFLEMFVFRKVDRVYEFLILIAVAGLMFYITYASFLMANIFNVVHFKKEIPLVQVAKTTSLLLTLISIYASTYVVLESSVNIYLTIVLLAILHFALIITHIRHLGVPRNVLWKRISTVFLLIFIATLTQIVIGGNSLITAIVPTVVAYSLINIITIENHSPWQKFEYFLMTLIAFALNFFFVS